MSGLRINGVFYDTEALKNGIFPDGEWWQQELSAFLQEWSDVNLFVSGHTSGSTGLPKEMKLLKADMLASARITNDFFHLSAASNLLLCLSPTYIAGKMMVVRAWLSGANLLAVKPSALPQPPAGELIQLAAMVPMQVEEVLKSDESFRRLGAIEQLLIGGAPVSPALSSALQSLGTVCFVTYGMTETVSHIALKRLNGQERTDVYFALGEVTFETDERDCLVILAPHLQQRRFVTNDIVHLFDKQHFEWKGRYDHVINSGGIKLYPESIEKSLSGLISERFFIISQPDKRLGEKAVLVVEGETWENEKQEKLKESMSQHLPKYEIPKSILFRKKFKETDSGKVVRSI